MACLCVDDNMGKLIGKYRQQLISSTNIQESPEEMKVLHDLMFRLYQMGWLDDLEKMEQIRSNLDGLHDDNKEAYKTFDVIFGDAEDKLTEKECVGLDFAQRMMQEIGWLLGVLEK